MGIYKFNSIIIDPNSWPCGYPDAKILLVHLFSFENDLEGWEIQQSTVNAGNGYGFDTNWSTLGDYSYNISVAYDSSWNSIYFVRIVKNIDLMLIQKIVFDVKTGVSNGTGGGKSYFAVDGNELWSSVLPDQEYKDVEIDLSGLSGNLDCKFEVWCQGSVLKYGQLFIDNIRFY